MAVPYYGDFAQDDIVYLPFNTFDSNDPASSVTATDLLAADIFVHLDGSATSLTTDGATIDIDAPGVGAHMIAIDTNAHADFVPGDYAVRINGVTVDGNSGGINAWIGAFSIERPGGVLALLKATTLASIKAETALIVADTNELQADDYPTSIAALQTDLNTLTAGVNVTAISGDTSAADNLELMYDGTGYTDETAPASRQQVLNIGAAAGAALPYEATADNTAGAIIDAVTIVGSITANLFTDTEVENGTRHQLTHSANAFDFVYRLPIGGGRTAVVVEWRGYLTSSNDDCSMQAYDFGGDVWDTVASIAGTNGSVNGTVQANLLSKHTGSGSELGNIYIRFVCTGQTSPVLNTDLLLILAVNIGQTVGYANGAIWIDTAGSNTSTELFVDGVADNPVSTIAAAKTISGQTGLGDFHIHNGSSITLGESTVNESYFGDNWTLAINGQDVTDAHFQGAHVTGVAVGAAEYFDCEIGTHTTIDGSSYEHCTLEGTITLPTGNIYIDDAHHGGPAVLDYGAAVGDTTVHVHKFAGVLELHNFGDSGTDILHLDGQGKLIINANSSGGTINLRGLWKVEDNAGGSATINYDDINANTQAILVDTGTTLETHLTDMQGGTFSGATDSLEAIRNRGDAEWTTGAGGSSPTVAQIADGVWEEAQADHVAAGSMGVVASETASILVDTAELGAAVGASLSADIAAIKTETALIVADTSELQGDDVPGLISTLDAVVDTVKAETALIVADTNELQGDDVPGLISTLDAVVDTVKAETVLILADTADMQPRVAAIEVDTGTTLQGELDGIQADTEDIQARLPAALASGNMKSDALALNGSTSAAANLALSALGIITGAVEAGTLSTTQASSDLTGYANDQLIGRTIIFKSGNADGEATDITDYVSTNGVLTFTALTTAPGAADIFVIV